MENQENVQNFDEGNAGVTPAAKPTSSYNGWIVADEFYKRALAIFGYALVGQIMVGLIILVVLLLIGLGA